MTQVSRRDLGRLAAGIAASSAVPAEGRPQAPEPRYSGPLTGIDRGLEGRGFDPVAYSRDLFGAAPRRLGFQARTRPEAEVWQRNLTEKVTELLGGFPSGRQALAPVTLETRTFPGYTREKIVFDARPGVSVLAYVLVPAGARRPAPVMICVPGHGRGVDDIVGIDDRGRDRTDKAGYQHDFALQVVEAGMAAVAIEPLGFGCRRDPINARQGLSRSACQPSAGGALLVGQTMLGWRVWDVMRTMDYIATRQDLDAARGRGRRAGPRTRVRQGTLRARSSPRRRRRGRRHARGRSFRCSPRRERCCPSRLTPRTVGAARSGRPRRTSRPS